MSRDAWNGFWAGCNLISVLWNAFSVGSAVRKGDATEAAVCGAIMALNATVVVLLYMRLRGEARNAR
jgi:hypothetical protein